MLIIGGGLRMSQVIGGSSSSSCDYPASWISK